MNVIWPGGSTSSISTLALRGYRSIGSSFLNQVYWEGMCNSICHCQEELADSTGKACSTNEWALKYKLKFIIGRIWKEWEGSVLFKIPDNLLPLMRNYQEITTKTRYSMKLLFCLMSCNFRR